MVKVYIHIIALLFLVSFHAIGQTTDSLYNYHCQKANKYTDVSFYTSSIEEWQEAMAIAESSGNEEQYINAVVSLAEVLRKIQYFDLGIQHLRSIKNSEKYPLLHVRKLGRLAALYNEQTFPPEFHQYDSVRKYLHIAIPLAEKHGFRLEVASLKTELGTITWRYESAEKGLELFYSAAKIFMDEQDMGNYVNVMIHVMDIYYQQGRTTEANEISEELQAILKDKKWYTLEVILYNLISYQHRLAADSLNYFDWKLKSKRSQIKNMEDLNSKQMAAFRVIHDTQLLKEDAIKKARELEQQKRRTKELVFYIMVMLSLTLITAGLFIREIGLKGKLKEINDQLVEGNEKYQLLLLESNHRIKNNLQMIISMIQFDAKSQPKLFKSKYDRLTGKIHTISALHKYLYMDGHNELVRVKEYFTEIFALYRDFSDARITFKPDLDAEVLIKSERIVYFGLILNELITNSLEHNEDEHLTIEVHVVVHEKHVSFCYLDYSSFKELKNEGTGIRLIKQLVNRVEGYNFHSDPSSGKYKFDFYV
ncbi:MAG: sensor histidine kinase [Flavobacteriales bacterium]|nr:sensor histidine kinase [Flavobacteriales bacterium]